MRGQRAVIYQSMEMRMACEVLAGEEGQMSVELAATLPIVLVVALIILNLMRFVGACAQFDRVAPNAVVSQGVSPPGEQTESGAVGRVTSCIEDAMRGDGTYSVEVRASSVALVGEEGSGFSIGSNLTRYTCTFRMRPWPSGLSIAGIGLGPPIALEHTRSYVVDRFKPGVVI